MQRPERANLVIAVLAVVFGLFTAFVWVPLDTATGVIEKVRGRQTIGDALAPTLACAFLVLGGVIVVLMERGERHQPRMSRAQAGFLLRSVAAIVAGVLVMRWSGPALAELANLVRAEPVEYRLLRATPGWKHVGFVLGGVVLVAGLISVVERRVSLRGVLVALGAVAAIIALFDLPFEDLLLPPNGDV
ncbi:MAG: hypothetical protein AAF092_14415 [Pseudomonadota bacterium]